MGNNPQGVAETAFPFMYDHENGNNVGGFSAYTSFNSELISLFL
jgi:hypothetical protein